MTRPAILDRLEALPKARQAAPGKWIASCPGPSHARGDKNPSVDWSLGDDGRVLLKCHGGCATEQVVAAVDMGMKDLFVPRPKGRASANGSIAATYSYRDEHDVERFQVVRYSTKTFRQRRPDGNGGWIWDIRGIEPFLYRLPELLASPGDDVVVVEGEKDVDRLTGLGILATTNPMGAGKWRSVLYNPPLAGRRVVVIPDRDRKGWEHAISVVAALRSTADVRILELTDVPEKGDVSDWLGKGHTVDELRELLHTAPEPDLPSAVELGEALEDVERFIARFVIFARPEARLAVTLFVAHPYVLDAADTAAYLAVSSPEKSSGKTRLLEVISLLVPGRPNIIITPTAATIFRTLEADPDMVLILDELDAVFGDRSDKFEEVRGIINAGHRRGATVPRSVGNQHEVVHFPVFGPKALAGIGRLPDTVTSRAIPIRMLKRKRTETVDKFRIRFAAREAAPIAARLAAALSANPPATEADVPDELGDRAADVWEPLLAIANAAGGDWPTRARQAAILLQGDTGDEESLALRLLADTRVVRHERADAEDRIATAVLIDALKKDEEAPWQNADKPLTPERLAKLLRPFGVKSAQMKIAGVNVRGYHWSAFADAWERYLPEPATTPVDPLPRYSEHDQGSEVAGSAGGSGYEEVPVEDDYPSSSWSVDPPVGVA